MAASGLIVFLTVGLLSSGLCSVSDECRGNEADCPWNFCTVQGLARQLGCSGNTLWRAVKPVLEATADDETRFAGVTCLSVDEHIWHHVSTKPVDLGGRGPNEFTGMVDPTRDERGRVPVRSRLLDLVVGRSGDAYKSWLKARGERFRAGVEVATLDPFHGYKNAIDDQLEDATAMLDAFHVVKLAPVLSTR